MFSYQEQSYHKLSLKEPVWRFQSSQKISEDIRRNESMLIDSSSDDPRPWRRDKPTEFRRICAWSPTITTVFRQIPTIWQKFRQKSDNTDGLFQKWGGGVQHLPHPLTSLDSSTHFWCSYHYHSTLEEQPKNIFWKLEAQSTENLRRSSLSRNFLYLIKKSVRKQISNWMHKLTRRKLKSTKSHEGKDLSLPEKHPSQTVYNVLSWSK